MCSECEYITALRICTHVDMSVMQATIRTAVAFVVIIPAWSEDCSLPQRRAAIARRFDGGGVENAGFNAKVQRNLGLDFVTK